MIVSRERQAYLDQLVHADLLYNTREQCFRKPLSNNDIDI